MSKTAAPARYAAPASQGFAGPLGRVARAVQRARLSGTIGAGIPRPAAFPLPVAGLGHRKGRLGESARPRLRDDHLGVRSQLRMIRDGGVS